MILTRMETREGGGLCHFHPFAWFDLVIDLPKSKFSPAANLWKVHSSYLLPPFPRTDWSGSDARCSDGPTTNDPRSDRGPIQDQKSRSHRPQMGTLKFTPRQLAPSAKVLVFKEDKKQNYNPSSTSPPQHHWTGKWKKLLVISMIDTWKKL